MGRTFIVAVLVAALGACGTATEPNGGSGGAGGDDDRAVLSYSMSPEDTFVYQVELNQTIHVTSEGEGAAPGGDDDLPGQAEVQVTATGTLTFTVAEGPRGGTYEIAIVGDITEVSAAGSIDGEPLDPDEVPEFAEVAPVETTIVVDDKGNPIADNDPADSLTGSLFGDLMSGMGPAPGVGMIPGVQLGQFFGPVLAEEAVGVGDEWSSKTETPGFGGDRVVTSRTSTITGTDTIDGSEVLLIETDTVTEAFQLDLGAFLTGFLGGFAPGDASDEERAKIERLADELRFVMSFDESASSSTARFDPGAGLTRSYDISSQGSIAMDLNLPDDTTGEMIGLALEMRIEQRVIHTLVDAPSG